MLNLLVECKLKYSIKMLNILISSILFTIYMAHMTHMAHLATHLNKIFTVDLKNYKKTSTQFSFNYPSYF